MDGLLCIRPVPMTLALWHWHDLRQLGVVADRALVPAISCIMIWKAVFLAGFFLFASSGAGILAVLFLVGCGFASGTFDECCW